MPANTIDEMVTTLYEMIQDAGGIPLMGDRCVIEREKALDILDEIRANIPSDLKMAREIVEKRNDIIAAGKKEYDSLKKQAEDYAKQKTNEHEITQEARKKAAELVSAAEARAREIMRSAGDYCDDAMKRTEEALSQSLDEIRQSRAQFKQAIREQQKN